MSGEFANEYNGGNISIAIEGMEQRIYQVGNIATFLGEVHDAYTQFPEGKDELRELLNVATIITTIGEGSFNSEKQAMYHGQLLALELFNTLTADNGAPFKGGFARSFLESKVRESLANFSSEDLFLEKNEYWYKLGRKIQLDLSTPAGNRQFDPRLETFAWKAAEGLSNDIHCQYLTVAGFRLILSEASKSFSGIMAAKQLSINDLPDEYDHSPSTQLLQEIVSSPDDLRWEDISRVRQDLIKKYLDERRRFQDIPIPDMKTVETIVRHIEKQLEQFNQSLELLKPQDLLSIRGEFFGVTNKQDKTTATQLYTPEHEIRGLFNGIYLVEAPMKEYLPRAITHREEYEKTPPPVMATPVLRIADPVLIFHIADELPEVEKYGMGTTMDIPLTYDNVRYNRIKADALENQA